LSATLFALPEHRLQPRAQGFDPHRQKPAVGFQLGFTRAAQADAAFLPFQVCPAAHQAGGQVAQLRQFHLQLAFVRACPLRKNIQNQAGAVEHATLDRLFEVSFLNRRQGRVHQHQVGVQFLNAVSQFVRLARADIKPGIGRLAGGGEHVQHFGPGRTGQFGKFLQFGGVYFSSFARAHQDGPVAALIAFKHARSFLAGGQRVGLGRAGARLRRCEGFSHRFPGCGC